MLKSCRARNKWVFGGVGKETMVSIAIMYTCVDVIHLCYNYIIAEYIYSVIIRDNLLSPGHFAKCFISTNSFTTHSRLKWMLLLSPLYR